MFNQINVLGIVLYLILVIAVFIMWYGVYKGWGFNLFGILPSRRMKRPDEAGSLERFELILITFILTISAILPVLQYIISSFVY